MVLMSDRSENSGPSAPVLGGLRTRLYAVELKEFWTPGSASLKVRCQVQLRANSSVFHPRSLSPPPLCIRVSVSLAETVP